MRNPNLLTIVSLLVLLSGCGKKIELPTHDESFLDQMADIHTAKTAQGYLTSDAGFTLLLPLDSENDKCTELPVHGLYFGGLRLLQGWEWDNGVIDNSAPIIHSKFRPDYIERNVLPGCSEKIFLAPNDAVCLISLNSEEKGLRRFTPKFDFRPIGLSQFEGRAKIHEKQNILTYGSPSYGYISVWSNAEEYRPDLKNERVEYAAPYLLLEDVATNKQTGRFIFTGKKEAVVLLGYGISESSAIEAVVQASKATEEIREKSTRRVLTLLNKSPVHSQENYLESLLAWDRWLLRANLNIFDQPYLHPLPPLLNDRAPIVDSRAMAAWFWAAGKDSIPNRMLTSMLSKPVNKDSDPEEFLSQIFTLHGYNEWLDLSGDGTLIDSLAIQLAKRFEMLVNVAKQNDNQVIVPELTPWNRKSERSGLIVIRETNPSPYTLLLHETVTEANSWYHFIPAWNDLFKVAYRTSRQLDYLEGFPLNLTLARERMLWSDREKKAWETASFNHDFNLGTIETILRADRRTKKYNFISQICDTLWGAENGYVFRHNPEYKDVQFPAAALVFSAAEQRYTSTLNAKNMQYFLHSRYAEYFDSRINLPPDQYPGGSPYATETIAERVRFFYENIAGIHPNPKRSIIRVAPTAPREIWKNRATTVTLDFKDETVAIFLDPYNGVYRFDRPEGDSNITVDLLDIPINGKRMNVNFAMKVKGQTFLERTGAQTGEPGFNLDNHEMKDIQRLTHDR
ncbi:hypothetical protein K8I28_07300 [bacterium]|nr:hypothetical protein [bacterium]